MLSKRHSFLPTRAIFFISGAGNIESVHSNFKRRFSSSYYCGWPKRLYAHINTQLYTYKNIIHIYKRYIHKNYMLISVVSNEHVIVHFWVKILSLKQYPTKLPQNCFDSFDCFNETGRQISKFSFVLEKLKKLFWSFSE